MGNEESWRLVQADTRFNSVDTLWADQRLVVVTAYSDSIVWLYTLRPGSSNTASCSSE